MPNRNTGVLASPLQVGDVSSGDYCETRPDGTVRLVGDSTAWRDMIMDLSGRRLSSTAGKVDYDYDEVAIEFQSGGNIATANDRVVGNQEINHQYKVGTGVTFRPHIHWWQTVASSAVLPIVFTLQWRLQANGEAKATSWTAITADAGAGGDDIFDHTAKADDDYNQITRFADIVVTCGVSDTLQFRMARTDSETGSVLAYFFDVHGQVDSFGSDEEITKAA